MENENSIVNIKEISETLTASLDSTQKNATDTSRLTQQVQDLSCKGLHEEAVRAILADDKTTMAEKMDLIHQENADYDQHEENNTGRVERLQNTQTDNVGKIIAWWSENWGWVAAVAGVTIFFGGTPVGKRMVTTAVKRLAA